MTRVLKPRSSTLRALSCHSARDPARPTLSPNRKGLNRRTSVVGGPARSRPTAVERSEAGRLLVSNPHRTYTAPALGHPTGKGTAAMPRLFAGHWRRPDFLKLWAGDVVSVLGSQVTTLALPLTTPSAGTGLTRPPARAASAIRKG